MDVNKSDQEYFNDLDASSPFSESLCLFFSADDQPFSQFYNCSSLEFSPKLRSQSPLQIEFSQRYSQAMDLVESSQIQASDQNSQMRSMQSKYLPQEFIQQQSETFQKNLGYSQIQSDTFSSSQNGIPPSMRSTPEYDKKKINNQAPFCPTRNLWQFLGLAFQKQLKKNYMGNQDLVLKLLKDKNLLRKQCYELYKECSDILEDFVMGEGIEKYIFKSKIRDQSLKEHYRMCLPFVREKLESKLKSRITVESFNNSQ